jgi:hypothetical protein
VFVGSKISYFGVTQNSFSLKCKKVKITFLTLFRLLLSLSWGSIIGTPTFSQTISTHSCPVFSLTPAGSSFEEGLSCDISLCAGQALISDLCDCQGDTYLRLYDWRGVLVDENDNGVEANCGSCSQLSHAPRTFIAGCKNYSLVQSCRGTESCSGQTTMKVLRAPQLNFLSATVISSDQSIVASHYVKGRGI